MGFEQPKPVKVDSDDRPHPASEGGTKTSFMKLMSPRALKKKVGKTMHGLLKEVTSEKPVRYKRHFRLLRGAIRRPKPRERYRYPVGNCATMSWS